MSAPSPPPVQNRSDLRSAAVSRALRTTGAAAVGVLVLLGVASGVASGAPGSSSRERGSGPPAHAVANGATAVPGRADETPAFERSLGHWAAVQAEADGAVLVVGADVLGPPPAPAAEPTVGGASVDAAAGGGPLLATALVPRVGASGSVVADGAAIGPAPVGSDAADPPVAVPTPVGPIGTDPPLTPFVPDDGVGWGIVGALAAAAAAGFGVRHATLRRAIRAARRSATRDPLTGLPNRRLFDEFLARELQRGARKGVSVSLLVIDLDGFKRVNDTRGHAAGDEVLRTVAETIGDRVRGSDLPARLGGDEFGIVLPECAAADALRIGEGLCGRIEAAVGPAVTASVGVAAAPGHGSDPGALLRAADAALYRAKAGGRNQAAVAEPGGTTTT